jgi:hypothetical protein
LFLDDSHTFAMKARGTPTHVWPHATFDTGIKERKHHAKDARVGVHPANGNTLHAQRPQSFDRRWRHPITLFQEHDVVLLGCNEELGIARARVTAPLL